MWRMFRDARILGTVGVLFFLAVIATLNATVYSPEATVLRYLSALEDGRQADVVELVWGKGVAVDLAIALPSDSALRPHNASITKVSHGNEQALVTAAVDLGGKLVTSTFALREVGGWSPLAEWRFDVDPLATVSLSSTTVAPFSVNGAVGGQHAYTFVPVIAEVGSGSKWFDADPVAISATNSAAVYFASLAFTPTAQLTSEVNTEVRDYLDKCAAQKTLVPKKCPFAGFTAQKIVEGPVWTMNDYPSVDIAAKDGEWRVSGEGTVRLDVSLVDFATEKTEKFSEVLSFTISGTLAGLTEGKPRLVVENTVER